MLIFIYVYALCLFVLFYLWLPVAVRAHHLHCLWILCDKQFTIVRVLRGMQYEFILYPLASRITFVTMRRVVTVPCLAQSPVIQHSAAVAHLFINK